MKLPLLRGPTSRENWPRDMQKYAFADTKVDTDRVPESRVHRNVREAEPSLVALTDADPTHFPFPTPTDTATASLAELITLASADLTASAPQIVE